MKARIKATNEIAEILKAEVSSDGVYKAFYLNTAQPLNKFLPEEIEFVEEIEIERPKMVYLIIYECLSLKFNDSITEVIREEISEGNYQHPAQNTWFITSSLSLKEINDILQSKIINKDREHFMVILLNNRLQYKGWMPKFIWKWLKNKLNF